MLEEARKKGASIFVYLIFCLLIVIFVINFGPQGGQGGGCGDSGNVVVSVDGKQASQSSYHVAYSNPYNEASGKQRTYTALETLIRRELLAQEAERRGLRVTDDLVMDEIKKGHFFLGGYRAQIPGIFTEDGFWNQNAFRGWVGQLNVTRNSYIQEQQRGMLASMQQQLLLDSIQVSREEALSNYLFANNTVQYDVVTFRPEAYREAMKLTDADVERFLTTHKAEVEARFKTDERNYKAVKPQLRLRQIFIATLEEPKPAEATPPAPDEAKQDEPKKPDAKKPAVGMKIDDAKAKLEAVRTAATKDKQKFIDAAKQLNTDPALKNSGGELGWRTAESAMLGEKAVTDAVTSLAPGEMTEVIVTDRGAYLILAEDKREGDLTFDQVKHEIAKELAKDKWSKEAAKRSALAALDKARAGSLPLDQLYEKDTTPGNDGIDIQRILNDPNIPPEQKQQIIEMLLQQQGQSGSLTFESEDVPASWKAQADGAGGGSAAPAAAAPTAAAPTGSAAPAAGSAAPAPAADPAAVPATGAPTAVPATPAAEVTASTDKLPEFSEVAKATVARFGPAPRSVPMSGLGTSKEAANALFDELTPGQLANRVFETESGFVVVQLVSRTQPKIEDFEKDSDELVEALRGQRARQFVAEWLKERCEKLAKDGKIKPNPGLLRDTDDKGNLLPTQYQPCMSFR